MATREVALYRVEDAVNSILGVTNILRKIMTSDDAGEDECWGFNILANTLDDAVELIKAEVLFDKKEANHG